MLGDIVLGRCTVSVFICVLVIVIAVWVGTGQGAETEIWASSLEAAPEGRFSVFSLGDRIEVYFRVHQSTTSVQIWDFTPSGEQPILFDERQGVPQRAAPRETVHAFSKTASELGSETFILQAETSAGTVTATWDFSVAEEGGEYSDLEVMAFCIALPEIMTFDEAPRGDLDVLSLGIDELNKGCNSSYHLGQSLAVRFQVSTSNSVRATLSSVDREGGFKPYLAQTVPPSTTLTAAGSIGGRPGESTFILRAFDSARGWLNCTCQMHVRGACSMEEGFESGALSELPWQTGMYEYDAWRVTTSQPHLGRYAAQAASISDYERSFLALGFSTGQRGMLSFWYKVSSEASCDFLKFYIDGNERDSWSGEVGWTKASFQLSTGTHILSWAYEKDGDGAAGQDTAWIDDIAFEP